MYKIRQRLKEIFEDALDFNFEDEGLAFEDNLKPGDIDEWDSLSQINILSQAEKAFQIKFTMDDLIGITTVGTIVKSIESKLKG